MSTQLERDVSEIEKSVAVIATQMENVGQTLGEIKITIGKRSDDKTIKLWFKSYIKSYIDRRAERDSSPPVSPGIWSSLSEKQRTTIISAVVGLITTGSAILAMRFSG